MRVFWMIMFVMMFAVSPVMAVETDLDITIDLGASSAYVWRGKVINDEAVIQPQVIMGANGFSFNVQGAWDLKHETNSSENTRMDISAGYSMDLDLVRVKPGVTAYVYHDESEGGLKDTFETFVDIVFNLKNVNIVPSLTAYYDFGEAEGFYGLASIAHSIELAGGRSAIDMAVSVGAGDEKYGEYLFSYTAEETGREEDFIPEDSSLVDFKARMAIPIIFPEDGCELRRR